MRERGSTGDSFLKGRREPPSPWEVRPHAGKAAKTQPPRVVHAPPLPMARPKHAPPIRPSSRSPPEPTPPPKRPPLEPPRKVPMKKMLIRLAMLSVIKHLTKRRRF